jgi:hypothetical protein
MTDPLNQIHTAHDLTFTNPNTGNDVTVDVQYSFNGLRFRVHSISYDFLPAWLCDAVDDMIEVNQDLATVDFFNDWAAGVSEENAPEAIERLTKWGADYASPELVAEAIQGLRDVAGLDDGLTAQEIETLDRAAAIIAKHTPSAACWSFSFYSTGVFGGAAYFDSNKTQHMIWGKKTVSEIIQAGIEIERDAASHAEAAKLQRIESLKAELGQLTGGAL